MPKLISPPDTLDIQQRLTIALSHMHPDRTEFTLPEVMEGLRVIGELTSTETEVKA